MKTKKKMAKDICGVYADPLHGGCLRTVSMVSTGTYRIDGAYGDDEPPHSPGSSWSASVVRDGKFLIVDFSSKTVSHARVYSALWCPSSREIHWEDGNVWKKLYSSASPSSS